MDLIPYFEREGLRTHAEISGVYLFVSLTDADPGMSFSQGIYPCKDRVPYDEVWFLVSSAERSKAAKLFHLIDFELCDLYFPVDLQLRQSELLGMLPAVFDESLLQFRDVPGRKGESRSHIVPAVFVHQITAGIDHIKQGES